MTLQEFKTKLGRIDFFKHTELKDVDVNFVDKLPYALSSKYTAQITSTHDIAIRKDKYDSIETLLSSEKGIKLLIHEFVHIKQAQEAGSFFKFVLFYIFRWVLAGFRYRSIKYERQAYQLQEVYYGDVV